MGSDGGTVIINQAASNCFPKVKPFCSVILSEAKEQRSGTVILSEAKELAFCIYTRCRHNEKIKSQQSGHLPSTPEPGVTHPWRSYFYRCIRSRSSASKKCMEDLHGFQDLTGPSAVLLILIAASVPNYIA